MSVLISVFLKQTLSMEIPFESSIAIHTLQKQQQNKAEQQQLKKLVLDYEQRSESAEKQGQSSTGNCQFLLLFTDPQRLATQL